VALHSDGQYGVEKGLICSYPARNVAQKLEVVNGLPLNDFSRGKIAASVSELKEEKSMVADLLPK
jgi:malate dehydrogenase